MSDSKVQTYQDLTQKFVAAGDEVKSLVAIIAKGAETMREWPRAIVTNSGAIFPPELVVGRPGCGAIDASQWPSANLIAEKLLAWHSVRAAMREAYQAIPSGARDAVKPPA